MTRKITKTQKQELLAWFDEFVSTIDSRLDAWLKTLPSHYRDKLDKSPESLFVLSDYLMENFATADKLEAPEAQTILDAVFTYAGEVHRLNYPAKAIWKPNLVEGPLLPTSFFKARVGLDSDDPTDIGQRPDSGIFYCVQQRSRERIHTYFNACANDYKKSLIRKKQAPIPGKGGESYHCYCLQVDKLTGFAALAAKIDAFFKGKYVSFKTSYYSDKRLLLEAGDNYYFHFHLRQDVVSKGIASDIAKAYKGDVDKATILASDTVFEFWGDDDSEYMEYFNHHIELMQFMNSLNEFLVYSEVNQCMWDDI